MTLPMFFSQAVLGGTSHSASCLLIFLKVSPEASDMLQCIFYACCSVLRRPIAITRGFLLLSPVSESHFLYLVIILLGLCPYFYEAHPLVGS